MSEAKEKLFALEDAHEAMLANLIEIGYELWSSQITGGSPASTHRRFDRMSHPCVGDTVLEVTTCLLALRGRHCRTKNVIGKLEEVISEPYTPWDDKDEPAPMEKVYYLRQFDGVLFRWRNARLVCIKPKDGWQL